MDQFKIVAKTLAGLEEILAKEIEQIGGINIAIGTRMVSYLGDKQLLYKSNLWLRTALRVLKPIESFQAADPDELYQKVKDIDWLRYIAEGQTIAIDNTIFSENFRNSRYAIYRCKDAICDFFVEHGMKRPKVAVASADVQLNLHITDEECTLSLDSSGEPLYKRGYKEQLTDAPISEVLAAGILLKAGWDGQRDLLDPMCGSGTFLIEAALIATNTPAGLYRKHFGFQRWTVGDLAYDAELWQDLYDDDSQEREFPFHIYGADISKVAIEATTENVRAAGLSKHITLEVRDFEDTQEAPKSEHTAQLQAEGQEVPGLMVVTNPPYGKRLFTDVPTFYRMVGSVLKKNFQGAEAWLISSEEKVTVRDPRTHQKVEAEPFDYVGLKPSIKIDLNNGGIACQLHKYELFAGKFDAFRAEGGELDKQSADQKEDNSRFDRVRRPRDGRKSSDRDRKPFDKDRKPFDRDRKPFDKDRKPFDRDRKPFDKDRKPFDRPKRTSDSGTERSYSVRKDGSIAAAGTDSQEATEQKPFVKRERKPFDGERKSFDKDRKPFDRDRKPFNKDRKPFDKDRKPFGKDRKPFVKREDGKELTSSGNFRRKADGTFEEIEGRYTPRGKRQFDPKRPMFREDFDMSKAVLDYTKPETPKEPKDE